MANATPFSPNVFDAHLRRIGETVPDTTSAARLRALQERYQDPRDPTIGVLPPWYRTAIATRLRALLAQSVAEGAPR
jgi:hypothetical protein